MLPTLQHSFDKLERSKQQLLAELETWPPAQLSHPPDQSSWSAADVLDHLLKTEYAFLQNVSSNLPHGHPVPLKARLITPLVFGVMRLPVRVKMPAAVVHLVRPRAKDIAQTIRRWHKTRTEIATLLDRITPPQLHCGLFLHPIIGIMPLPQAITFLALHLRHHRYQFNRIKQALSASH